MDILLYHSQKRLTQLMEFIIIIIIIILHQCLPVILICI
jgi:hypothetical protein